MSSRWSLEKHKHHPDDAIGRLDGYVIAVAGAAGQVGETVRVAHRASHPHGRLRRA